jgi:hypothetical protein
MILEGTLGVPTIPQTNARRCDDNITRHHPRYVRGKSAGILALKSPFWTMEGAARAANQANFYKNLAIMAAYLLLAITGAGRYSLDHRAASAPSKAVAASA